MNKDETLVPFRGRAIALALLAEAEKQGLPASVVKTTMGGYIVPTKVAKKVDLEKVRDNADPAPYSAEPFAPASPADEDDVDEPAVEAEPEPDEPEADEADDADEAPALNASRDEWLAYAQAKVAAAGEEWNVEDDDLGRNELAAKFGTPSE